MIEGYGRLREIPGALLGPLEDLGYKVLFDCRTAEEEGGVVAPALDRLARFINLLGGAGVPPDRTDLAIVFHGPTAAIALQREAHIRHFGAPNANEDLLTKLHEHGVKPWVCGQSVLSHGFALGEVDQKVGLAVSALIVLANYQLQGYALLAY